MMRILVSMHLLLLLQTFFCPGSLQPDEACVLKTLDNLGMSGKSMIGNIICGHIPTCFQSWKRLLSIININESTET